MSAYQAVINGIRRVEERIAEDNKGSAKFSFTPIPANQGGNNG